MWNEIFKRWIDGLFWWLPRNEEGPPEKEEEGAGGTEHSTGRGPEQAVEQQVEAVKEVIADDLTVIKGIGPSVPVVLLRVGIALVVLTVLPRPGGHPRFPAAFLRAFGLCCFERCVLPCCRAFRLRCFQASFSSRPRLLIANHPILL